MEYHAPAACPVCGGTMKITRLNCKQCGTELSGAFSPCRFCRLEEKHMQFIEAFLRCRGSIKEVEKMLGVSYPTVKNMLEAALTALGFQDAAQQQASKHEEAREAILEKLSNKEIDVDAAVQALRSLKGE